LSPISARKNTTVVVTSGPGGPFRGFIISIRDKRPDAEADEAETENPFHHAVGTRLAAHTPTDEARAWLIVVAIRMPSMTAQGRRYREAIDNATN